MQNGIVLSGVYLYAVLLSLKIYHIDQAIKHKTRYTKATIRFIDLIWNCHEKWIRSLLAGNPFLLKQCDPLFEKEGIYGYFHTNFNDTIDAILLI
jgi:hypothetical protein